MGRKLGGLLEALNELLYKRQQARWSFSCWAALTHTIRARKHRLHRTACTAWQVWRAVASVRAAALTAARERQGGCGRLSQLEVRHVLRRWKR